ncbi:MAG: alpha-ketoacid dehydrogenase subunit beta [Armatimonadota bacterium]|nr:MAG: alpha-ketoacid dehydrogenase subunit beta [Armatimonadota bacterium]
MREVAYALAVRTALREEMLRDDRVFLMGEDIGVYGGVYGATRGLQREFGEERVRDTPISEAAIAGMAVGAAIGGLRPVAEIMYCDFLSIALDAIANNAAKLRYMSGGQLEIPMVIRTSAGGHGYAAQHSQSLETWVTHIPGLKVVTPGNCGDARGLLKSAIRDPNPVVVIEHKALYQTTGAMPAEETLEPIGVAKVVREGKDVTLVSWSAMAGECVAAAEEVADDGIEVEVIDLRTLLPVDLEPVIDSVRKTGRLVVAHEAVTYCGLGAEVVAQLTERAWEHLKQAPVRVGSRFAPIPFAEPLENHVMADRYDVVEAVRACVRQ